MTISRLLITLDDARVQLSMDGTLTDDELVAIETELQPYVEAASSLIINYLKSGADSFLNHNGTVKQANGLPDVPYAVQIATRMMLGYLYKNRDNDEGREYQHGYLPMPVIAMLYPLRDPALS